MGERRARNRVIGSAAALVLVAVAAPGAQAWDRPLELTDKSAGLVPQVAIDRHGTTRGFAWSKPGRYEVLSLRAGSRRVRRCRVPGSYPDVRFGYGVGWAANPAGAMAVGFNDGLENTRIFLASAAPGKCFVRPKPVSARGRTSKLGKIAIGPLGTALAVWEEQDGHGRVRHRFVAAAGGHRPGASRRLRRSLATGTIATGVQPAFFSRDRVVWRQTVAQPIDRSAGRYLYRTMSAASAPRAGRIGRYREVARTSRYDDVLGDVLTDGRGGQVLGVFDNFAHLLLRTRTLGRAFGAPQSIPITNPYEDSSTASAGNGAGDTAWAWTRESTVYVLIRRRGGRVVGPQAIAVANGLRLAERPVVAIDGAGRAMVAWVAKDAERNHSGPGEVQVATPVSGRRLGPAVRVSGPARRIFDDISVAVNSRGRAAVGYRRLEEAPVGVVGVHDYVVRGRLGQ